MAVAKVSGKSAKLWVS